MIKGFSKEEAQACLDKCTDDEPVFLIRGQDRNMVGTVSYWVDILRRQAQRHKLPKSFEKAEERRKGLREVRAWQEANEARVKHPD